MNNYTCTIIKTFILITGILAGTSQAYSCGGYWDPEGEYYSFFHQTIISDQTLYPFLYTPAERYFWGEGDKSNEDPNLVEWTKLLDKNSVDEGLSSLIYNLSLENTWQISDAIHGIENGAITDWGNVDWKKDKYQDVLNYLIFAKKCQNQSRNPEYGWYYSDNAEPLDFEELLEEGKILYKSTKNKALKMRFGYQLVRLAHYSGDYDLAVQLFEQKVEVLGIKNYMYYRALEQEAGAINFSDPAKAAYLFSIVFDQLPDRRIECMNSFGFTSERSWNQALMHCKTAEEKAVFHVMRAFKQYGNELAEMEKVADLDPDSEYLELLLARQINQTERDVFPSYTSSNEQFPKRMDAQQQIEMLAVLLENKNLKNRDLFKYGLGFFQLVSGDFDAARGTLNSISKSSELYTDAFGLLFTIKLMELEQVNEQAEVALWEEFKKDGLGAKCGDLEALMLSVLEKKYYQQGEDVKGFLCSQYLSDLQQNAEIPFLEKLEAFYSRNDLNSFETYIADRAANGNGRLQTIEMRGNFLLKFGEYEEAARAFDKLDTQVPKAAVSYSNTNYFQPHIFGASVRHWYSDNFEYIADKEYQQFDFLSQVSNKLFLAKTLKKLKDKATQPGPNQATYFYLLGNATYNLSPNGWHRPILHYREENWSHNMTDNYPYDLAAEYYEKARELSSDQEFKAKVTYMLARVEQASSYYDYHLRKRVSLTSEPYFYFGQLSDDYSTTAYYDEIIRECAFFRDYLGE